jgi:EmrB/QacA subfamily drug resistance transporter
VTPTSRASRHPSIALAIIVTCQLMVVLDATVVNIALSPIQHSLHFSDAGLSWVIDAYTLTFGGLLLLGGRAGDLFGRRRMLILGLAVFTVSSLLGGLATDSTMLLITRAVQGVGAAMAAPSTLSLISATFPEGHARNRALGVFSGVSAGGASLGLLVGGALTSWASWRWVLFINVPIGVAIILLAPRFIPEPPRNGGRIDLAGGLLATSAIGTLIYGFIRIAESGSAGVTAGVFVLSAALLVSFVLVESRTARPLMPIRLLTDRLRGSSYLVMLLVPAAMYGMFFFMSQFFENSLGYSPIKTGLAFLPFTGLIFLCSRIVPRVIQRVGARPFLLAGLSLISVGLIWMAQISASSSYLGGAFGPLLLFGLGAGCTFMPLAMTILGGVPREDAGAASGMLQSMQQTGGALGVAVLESVAASHGQSDALLTAGAFAVVSLVVATAFIRSRRPATADAQDGAPAPTPVLID